MWGSKLLTLRASVITLVIFTLATGCGKNLESAVATVGGEIITVDDLRQEMVRQYRTEKEAARKSLEQREKALENLIERRLKVAGARAEGYFDTPEVKEREATLLTETIINRLYEVKILEAVVSDQVLRDTYDRQATEVQASHILFKWVTDSASVRQRALEVQREIRNGLPFADAAARYTEEPGGQERKGDLGWFSWGRMVPEFQEACWALQENEISAPLETRYGIHLIHLTGRRTVESRPTFEEQKESLKEMARNNMREQIMAAGNTYLEDMKRDLGYKLEEARVPQLLADIQANMQPELKLQEIFQSLAEGAWKDQVIASWKGGQMDMAGLAKSMERNFRPASSITTPRDVEDMVNNASIHPMLTARAKAEGLDKDKDVLKNVQQQLENNVVMTYERERIKGKVEVGEDQIAAWFAANPNDYMHPQMVRVQEVYVADRDLAQKLAERARKGENFGKLAKQYTERPDRKGTDGTLEPFQAGRYGKMGEAAFAMAVGDVSDPLPIGRNWSVIKLLEVIPPKPKALDEARTSIRMKLEREARANRHDAWRQEIEQKVPVVLYKEKLTTLFADVKDMGEQGDRATREAEATPDER
ncbi:MAG: peptidylprolyl isomerase [bacterium]|nr:peptidylprolyl isomerase [bacterium]